jgi:hypothetical protein
LLLLLLSKQKEYSVFHGKTQVSPGIKLDVYYSIIINITYPRPVSTRPARLALTLIDMYSPVRGTDRVKGPGGWAYERWYVYPEPAFFAVRHMQILCRSCILL